MPYEMKEGQITIFTNDKGGNDRRPDFRGECLIEGRKFKISLWLKQGSRGDFWGGQIEPAQDRGAAPPRQQQQQQGGRRQQPNPDPMMGDDPPF